MSSRESRQAISRSPSPTSALERHSPGTRMAAPTSIRLASIMGRTEMRRPGYREAVRWIAENDDTQWLEEPDPEGGYFYSVTCAMVADLFDKDQKEVAADISKAIANQGVKP